MQLTPNSQPLRKPEAREWGGKQPRLGLNAAFAAVFDLLKINTLVLKDSHVYQANNVCEERNK